MKKKLLSAMMATMMVLGVSVQANAAPQTSTNSADYGTFEWDATTHKQVPVEISGSVETAEGIAAAGKLKVELPTRMAFSVDKGGTFNGTSYTVKNQSDSEIVISVENFTKTNGGITVHRNDETITTEDRSHIKLFLEGNVGGTTKKLDLGAFNQGDNDNNKILEVATGATNYITLSGEAGQNVLNKTQLGSADATHVDKAGANATFNMIFKVEKKVEPGFRSVNSQELTHPSQIEE